MDERELDRLCDEALKLYKKGEYDSAFQLWKRAAENGFAEAQFNLGDCYENGQGVPQSREEAVKWYKKAAEQGHEEAIGILKQLGIN